MRHAGSSDCIVLGIIHVSSFHALRIQVSGGPERLVVCYGLFICLFAALSGSVQTMQHYHNT